MLEIIGYLIVIIAKVVWKFLYYTMPIFFVIIGFNWGGSIGEDCTGSYTREYRDELRRSMVHEVVIYWDEEQTQKSHFEVREDLNWNATGNLNIYADNLYSVFNYDETDRMLPSYAQREGYRLIGLFDTPWGGSQYVSSSGYSLMRVTEDIELYALWEEI